jgi:replicative DNA helicase
MSYTLGKVPPNSVEIEETVLGCMLSYPDIVDDVLSQLKPKHFYDEQHRIIYEGICNVNKTAKVDLFSVVIELKNMGKIDDVGGMSTVATMTSKIMPSHLHNINLYCEKIYDDWVKRDIIRTSYEMSMKAFDSNSSSVDVLTFSDKSISDIFNDRPSIKETDLLSGIEEAEVGINNRMELSRQGKLSGIDTGFKELNKMLGGYQRGDLIIIAARPSMGKTAIAINSAIAASKIGEGALFFSLEMNKVKIVDRIIANETNIPRNRYFSGNMTSTDWAEFNDFKKNVKDWVLDVDDQKQTVESIKINLRKLRKKKNVNLVVIDYLTLLDFSGMDKGLRKDEQISKATKALKRLAKDEDIPIILLSQLNRESDKRGGSKRPMLADLKESGSIEEDADVVLLLYRAEYYGLTEDDGASTKNMGEIIVAKHRNGAVGTTKYRHDGTMSKFFDFDKDFNVDTDFDVKNLPF